MIKKIYNLQQLFAIADNDQNFINSMIYTFLQEMPSYLEQLVTAIQENNREKTHSYAHKIKPSVDLFGLPCLSDVLMLEAWGKSDDPLVFNEYMVRVKNQLDTAMLQLKRDY